MRLLDPNRKLFLNCWSKQNSWSTQTLSYFEVVSLESKIRFYWIPWCYSRKNTNYELRFIAACIQRVFLGCPQISPVAYILGNTSSRYLQSSMDVEYFRKVKILKIVITFRIPNGFRPTFRCVLPYLVEKKKIIIKNKDIIPMCEQGFVGHFHNFLKFGKIFAAALLELLAPSSESSELHTKF